MSKIGVVQGDITTFQSDAIVNAANNGLWEGAGVCGAIFTAVFKGGGRDAHRRLTEACQAIGNCPTGGAVVTPSFGLQAPFIIHAVGPVWSSVGRRPLPEASVLTPEEVDLVRTLQSTYRSIVELCVDRGFTSVAIPSISTGIFGFPQDLAAAIAHATCESVCAELGAEIAISLVAYDEGAFGILSTAPSAAAVGWLSSIG
jgi:O-acetyl-ADP-ribose deacetylase (regulator of RNase III)